MSRIGLGCLLLLNLEGIQPICSCSTVARNRGWGDFLQDKLISAAYFLPSTPPFNSPAQQTWHTEAFQATFLLGWSSFWLPSITVYQATTGHIYAAVLPLNSIGWTCNPSPLRRVAVHCRIETCGQACSAFRRKWYPHSLSLFEIQVDWSGRLSYAPFHSHWFQFLVRSTIMLIYRSDDMHFQQALACNYPLNCQLMTREPGVALWNDSPSLAHCIFISYFQ